jgi:2-dehydropantoate 2-reductase
VPAAWAAFSRLVAEVCAVAEADGTPVPQAAQERALALAQAAEPGSFSSLHDDLVAGRRMELEALHGCVVRRAAQHHLAVPTSETVYAILQPWATRNQRAERPASGTSASESPAM